MKGWTSASIGKPKNESDLQIISVKWFREKYPMFRMSLVSVPNGGQRSITTAARLKREGCLAGCWDLLLLVPRGGYSGLFIETKFGKNNLTDNQKEFQKSNNQNYAFEIYYNLDEFKEIIQTYLNQF